MFHFKQFDVDQSGCAMKVNTDGVLLGALADQDDPSTILDIGTGTGVIALMMAQRFANAVIDAVEIDEVATKTASKNFHNSPFEKRVTGYALDFKTFFERYPDKRYDLIVSNPPFHIHSLKSKTIDQSLARHADERFFEELVAVVAERLTDQGICCLILPLQTAMLVNDLILRNNLYLCRRIAICSFEDSAPHREILFFGPQQKEFIEEKFVIYQQPTVYTDNYSELLKDFLTIF